MLTITDPTIKRMILEHMLEQFCSGDKLDTLRAGGVDPQLVNLLQTRATGDLVRAARMDQLVIGAHVDSTSAIRCFDRLDLIQRDVQLRDYFVVHGASTEMLAELFKLSIQEIRRLRQRLTSSRLPPGRVQLPAKTARQPIHESWALLQKSHPALRERIYRLHQLHSQYPINVLWATVHEFDAPAERVC